MTTLTGMADRILNWGGRAYKRASEALTCRGTGDICKTLILCIVLLEIAGG